MASINREAREVAVKIRNRIDALRAMPTSGEMIDELVSLAESIVGVWYLGTSPGSSAQANQFLRLATGDQRYR